MSESVILELQDLAADSRNNIADVLRKAYLVATKLDLPEFSNWLSRELHGYGVDDAVPEYRKVHAELKAENPYHGQVPFLIGDQRVVDKLCNVEMRESVPAIVQLLSSKGGTFQLTLPPDIVQVLMGIQKSYAPLYPVRIVERSEFANILEAVRTAILEWALRLEKEGIVGEGVRFSSQERERAAANIRIQNFQGILGNVSHSSVAQQIVNIQQGDFDGVRRYLAQNRVTDTDIAELEVALQTEKESNGSKFGPQVSSWIGKMVKKAADGSWDMAVETAAHLLATALWAYYGHGVG